MGKVKMTKAQRKAARRSRRSIAPSYSNRTKLSEPVSSGASPTPVAAL